MTIIPAPDHRVVLRMMTRPIVSRSAPSFSAAPLSARSLSAVSLAALSLAALSLAVMTLSACATTPAPLPAVTIAASAETEPVGTVAADAADDPAIWRNPANPAASLIIGTDKRAGIHVYTLSGRSIAFVAAGEINNVDLRDGVTMAGRPVILVGASDRNSLTQPRLALLTLDGATGALTPLATIPVDASGEAYGFCFGRVPGDRQPRAYIVTKQGRVLELMLDLDVPTPTARLSRSFGVATQSEGCVVDDRTGQLYLGEEDVGIWRFDLTTAAPTAIAFAAVGAEHGLVADVEGLALAIASPGNSPGAGGGAGTGNGNDNGSGSGGMLIASSQGDNAYTMLDLATGAVRGRFRINGGPIDGTYDTDGIDLVLGDFGPQYPAGLLVVQDGDNAPAAQNFKLVDWAAVLAATGLPGT